VTADNWRGGWLRRNVVVTPQADVVRIGYAHWEIAVPAPFLSTHPELLEVLHGRRSRCDLPSNPAYDGFLTLLDAQGCFTSFEKQSSYRFRELRRLFDPLRSAWYALYYAHPLWQRLRTGAASMNELIAWVIHNYHISRAAGIVGARLAACAPDPSWRDFFRRDTLEEYWHCDAYYFVRHPDLKINNTDVKAYVPLPSSLAFEVHTLQVAEHDPLGHLLIAYFQESSIAFYDDCLQFYEEVERAYGLPGFFATWQQHMQLDQDHGHAKGLGDLFDTDQIVPAGVVEASLRNAWLAYWFLCQSLDDVIREARPDAQIRLRLPSWNDPQTSKSSSFFDGRLPNWPRTTGATIFDLCRWLVTEIAGPRLALQSVALNERDIAYLLVGLTQASYQALSRAREHDEIVHLGNVCRALEDIAPKGNAVLCDSPWVQVIVHLLSEASVHPVECLALAVTLGQVARQLCGQFELLIPLSERWTDQAERYLATVYMVEGNAAAFLTRQLQFYEVLERSLKRSDRFFPEDVAL
jgi:hypothetical protein